jgi:enoyl-CoA hydratase/carnithine racemase
VKFDRPDHRNAVNGEMMFALADRIEEADAQGSRVLRIEAVGEDFCLGRDHTESPRLGSTVWTEEKWREMTRRAFDAFGSFHGVTVVAVNGRAYGFGAALAVGADVTIAADDSRLAFDEVPMGFAPRRVMTRLFNRLGERRITELVLTGRSVPAAEAFIIGMVTEVVGAQVLKGRTDEVVSTLLRHQPDVLSYAKAYLAGLAAMNPADRRDYEGPHRD